MRPIAETRFLTTALDCSVELFTAAVISSRAEEVSQARSPAARWLGEIARGHAHLAGAAIDRVDRRAHLAEHRTEVGHRLVNVGLKLAEGALELAAHRFRQVAFRQWETTRRVSAMSRSTETTSSLTWAARRSGSVLS